MTDDDEFEMCGLSCCGYFFVLNSVKHETNINTRYTKSVNNI